VSLVAKGDVGTARAGEGDNEARTPSLVADIDEPCRERTGAGYDT